ncbi:Elongator complex protein 1, partial [Bienertia sinuspersici]
MIDCNVTEIVGRVEGGVKCISPSPDGDLLAVTSGLGQLLVMTQDWDVLYETAFEDHPEDVDVSESINSLSNSRGNPISWRGDGRYFATLQDAKLEEDSDWMPSGAKIATVYDRRDENMCPSIAFFERNGLERSSFSINEPSDAAVEVLKWNCSSDLLSVLVGCGRYYSLKIWSFSNNHWYLKQVIKYSRQERLQVMWDPTKPLQLICWTSTGQISVYNFVWITAVMDNSVALVIDDSSILVTPLSLTLIPPPMYLFKLKFPSAVREMAFHSNNSKNQLAAYLSDGSLCFVELPALSFWEDLEGKEFAIEASVCDIAFGSFLHLEWLDSHILLGASHVGFHYERCLSQAALKNNKHLGYHLIEIMALCSENHVPDSVTCSSWNVKVSNQISVEKLVISIASNPAKKGSAFVQFNGGDVFEYVSQASMPQSASAPYFEKFNGVVFSSSCPWVTVAYVNSGAQLKPLSFGLNEHGVLHVDERILCNNCSSFSVYSNSSDQIVTHLILATKQDLLYVVDISDVLDGHAPVKYENFMHIASKRREEDCRNFINIWERGAKITGVLHGDEAAVILQTIRGNLECICPRKLVLTSIINALVQKRFKDALLMVRRHRIDFNIVVDFCGWQAFLPLASDFVSQVNNLSYITEFVCALKNENTSLKLYRNHISFPSANVNDMPTGHLESSDPRSKVSGVLLAIRKALEEQIPESPARELCILTTLARNDPPALEEALARIKVTREMELSGSSDQRRTSYPSAEEALKHLLWLSDADAVFQAALGLYDLNLAAIYRIDLHLKRYEKALKHIVCAGEAYHSDCMDLLKDQPQLFPLGLHLFTDPLKRNQIYEAWGDHLVNEKSFEEAATTFFGVLTVAGLLKLDKEEVLKLAQELCEELQALGKPGEAAKIALEYCGDVNFAISLLISAREWEEASRIAFMHRNDNLITEVKNASTECAGILISEYEEGLEKIGKYLTRYLAVRQRRLLLAAKLRSEEHSVNEVDDDTISEASSNFSGMSAYTT